MTLPFNEILILCQFFFSFPGFKCCFYILCKIVLQNKTSEVCFESFKDFRIILNPLMDQAGSMSFSSRVRLNRYILNYNQSSTCVAWHQYRKTCVETQLLKERTTYRSRKMIWYICLSNTSSVCSTSVHAQVAQTKRQYRHLVAECGTCGMIIMLRA